MAQLDKDVVVDQKLFAGAIIIDGVLNSQNGDKDGNKTSEPLVVMVDVPVTQMACEY